MEEETIEDVKEAYALLYRDMAALRVKADALLAFAQEFLSDYQSDDGLGSMKHYAGKAHAAIANYTGA